ALQTNAVPVVLNPNLHLRLVVNTTNSSTTDHSVRIAKDPRNNQLYYLRLSGDIFRLNLQPPGGPPSTVSQAYTAASHGLSSNVEGLALGPDGTLYGVGNITTKNTKTFDRIMKGV